MEAATGGTQGSPNKRIDILLLMEQLKQEVEVEERADDERKDR